MTLAPEEQAEFVALVREMRQAQKEYFKTRDRDVLNRSKSLERQVDKAIEAMNAPGLF